MGDVKEAMTDSDRALPDDEFAKKITETTALYYRQLDLLSPTAIELVVYLEQLQLRVQHFMWQAGLRKCLSLPAFLRYVLTVAFPYTPLWRTIYYRLNWRTGCVRMLSLASHLNFDSYCY